jgi:hypothetical protein
VAIEPFAAAEMRYFELVAARKGGSLDAPTFRLGVRALAVKDMEGREWILGPEDGQWHHRLHDRWVTANPPRRLVCPACSHHNLVRHSFCVECGKSLLRPVNRAPSKSPDGASP